jgi:hypothetical protein
MKVIYATQEAPNTITRSIFLAGPSPRKNSHHNWRPEALAILERLGFDGVVFIPLPENNQWSQSYDDQVDWETRYLNMADVIAFWVPRDQHDLPAFTTNVEFGMWLESRKSVLGYPPTAVKMKYLDHQARLNDIPVRDTLEDTMRVAVEMMGDGAERTGAERFVPLNIWRTTQFQQWYLAQTMAGNRLNGAKIIWSFQPQSMNRPFFWALHVDMHISAENRNKTNEIVLARPNISTVVAYKLGDSAKSTYVALVREYRSPAATTDGFVIELPGGSTGEDSVRPIDLAWLEFHEETGLALDPKKMRLFGSRQCLATMSAHRAYAFSYELSDHELERLSAELARTHGIAKDTERTSIEIHSLADIIDGKVEIDWSNLGMILSALSQR